MEIAIKMLIKSYAIFLNLDKAIDMKLQKNL